MSCLALALQPVNGSDVLLQTREWFHPARALMASSKFRETREAYANGKRNVGDGVDAGLGDEALAASGGQVVVGKESRYRVFYRLVNSIYVLGITSVDHDDAASNSFECAGIVNQAVSVLVAACKGVDVTPDKVNRRYTEIYMALDRVLRGVGAARLATILSTIHGEGIPQIVLSATDAENRARGADSWNVMKVQSIEHLANVDVLSTTTFEMPEETLAAGDEVAATLAAVQGPASQIPQQTVEEKPAENEDPFAVSDKVNKPEELAGGFKKSKEPSDVTAALADLEVPKAAAGTTAESMFIGVEGFEGEYGGLDFGPDGAAFGGAFEGLDNAFGGGLDAAEFGAVLEEKSSEGLGGLEELDRKPSGATQAPGATPDSVTKPENKPARDKPLLYISEEVHAHFRGSKLLRIGLQGALHVQNPTQQDASFSFRLDGCAGIKRAVMRNTMVGSLGKGIFHVRAPPAEDPPAIVKYRLHPRFTPVPVRLRLVTRQSGSLISFMIQYVSNPHLSGALREVNFIVALPFVPSLLKMSPKGSLNRHTKEIRWQVMEIPLKGSPGCLRAQMPMESDGKDANGGDKPTGKLKLEARIEFSFKGQSLSGITVVPATEGNTDFSVGVHTFTAGTYLCS